MLPNRFNADYTPAATVAGKSDRFAYYTRVFSNALLGTRSANGDAFYQYTVRMVLTDNLQLATRYQFDVADENNGLLAQRRNDRAAGLTLSQ